MRPPKPPRRTTASPRLTGEGEVRPDAPLGKPAREPASRDLPARDLPENRAARVSRPVRDQKPESTPPASDTPGAPARASVAKRRRERVRKDPPRPPVAPNRKKSSDPYPLSDRIEIRRKARRRALLIRLGVACGAVAALASVVWLLFFSTVFAITAENITLSISDPADIVDDTQVASILAATEGTPVLRIRAGDIESQIADIPEVESVTVESSFPHGITATIVAREPVACVGEGEACEGVAADATRLRVGDELRASLPKVSMDLDSERAVEQLQDLLDAIAALPQDVRARVQAASINPSGLIEFSLDSATIKWGTSTENEAKARIITVLLTQPATTYDVTVPGAPVTY
ncbi:cell division protein FtsQ/DivIB [Flaviflexus equikiangi]|uniref:cell division protein FtsQ/DivIB n=1 Tax=Flaviflexus equikiangi TaxID=2758573 RepID=UPI0015F688EB|nr:FtsQ-type POTRA domain-containing protein [Flaviflexus equikiangi]